MEVDVKSVFLAGNDEIEHKVLLVVATVKKHRLRACFDQIIQNTLFLLFKVIIYRKSYQGKERVFQSIVD